MKTFILSLAALIAFATAPAMANTKSHGIHSGIKSHTNISTHRSFNWYGNGYSKKRITARKKQRRLKKIRRYQHAAYKNRGYSKGFGGSRHVKYYNPYRSNITISGRNFHFGF